MKPKKPARKRILYYFVGIRKLEDCGDIRKSTAASQHAFSERQARAYLRKFRGIDLIEELYWAIPQDEWRHIATLSMPHTRNDLRGRPRQTPVPPVAKKRSRRKKKADPRQLTLFPK